MAFQHLWYCCCIDIMKHTFLAFFVWAESSAKHRYNHPSHFPTVLCLHPYWQGPGILAVFTSSVWQCHILTWQVSSTCEHCRAQPRPCITNIHPSCPGKQGPGGQKFTHMWRELRCTITRHRYQGPQTLVLTKYPVSCSIMRDCLGMGLRMHFLKQLVLPFFSSCV